MSGETEAYISGWTTDTLHAHLMHLLTERQLRYEQRFEAQEQRHAERAESIETRFEGRFEAQEKAFTAAIEAAERAVGKAEMASEKRFDSVNEFRATLTDQAATLMPRSEAETRFSALNEKLGDLTDRFNRETGKNQGVGIAWMVLVAVIGLATGGVGILLAVLRGG
jgi:hypothetical protein